MRVPSQIFNAAEAALLIKLKDLNFISWLLYNRCVNSTSTCETVNKSIKSKIFAYIDSKTFISVVLILRRKDKAPVLKQEIGII